MHGSKNEANCVSEQKKPTIWHEPSHEPKTVFYSLVSVILINVEMFLSCENTLSEIFFLKLLLFLASLTQNTTVIKVYIHYGLAQFPGRRIIQIEEDGNSLRDKHSSSHHSKAEFNTELLYYSFKIFLSS